MVAECLESGGGRPNCVGNVGIDLGVRADGVIEEPDTKPAGIPPDEIGVGLVLTRCDDAITGNVHDGGVEDRRRVTHRVTHDVLNRVAPLVHVRAHRDAASARLEADQATHRRGDADRTSAVTRVGRRQYTCSDRSGCAAGRTSRPAREIPRVAGWAIGEWLGSGAGAELGGIRSSEGDEACIPVGLDEMGVPVGNGSVILERLYTLVMRTSGFAGPQILHQHRHAMEGTVGERVDRCPRLVEVAMDHGVDVTVDGLHASDA